MTTYFISYSGNYEDGEQFSDRCEVEFTRKKLAIKDARERSKEPLYLLSGPEGQKIDQINYWVSDEKGSMIWG